MMIDTSTMMLLLFLGIIGILVYIVWKLWNRRPVHQPITKNQYERLNADFIASAKLNKLPGCKWIGITGDTYRGKIDKYFRYKGDEADDRMVNFLVQAGPGKPKRWLMVPWDLVENYGHGGTVWIRCYGFEKCGYFFRPILCKDQLVDPKYHEYVDNLINMNIARKLGIQAFLDQAEQNRFETVVSSSHKERPMSEMQQQKETPVMQTQEEIVSEPEV